MSRKEKHTVRGLRKMLSVVLGMSILLMGLTGCALRIATPPELTMAGVDITIGKTVLRDLTDFEFFSPGTTGYFKSLDPRTYAYDSIPAYNNGILYAYLHVYNPDSVTRMGMDCIIYEVIFKMNSEEENSWETGSQKGQETACTVPVYLLKWT